MRYRKKPLVIDAVQYDGYDTGEIRAFLKGNRFELSRNLEDLHIDLGPAGYFIIEKSDWLIKGIEGEFYICGDSVFQKTYECVQQR